MIFTSGRRFLLSADVIFMTPVSIAMLGYIIDLLSISLSLVDDKSEICNRLLLSLKESTPTKHGNDKGKRQGEHSIPRSALLIALDIDSRLLKQPRWGISIGKKILLTMLRPADLLLLLLR